MGFGGQPEGLQVNVKINPTNDLDQELAAWCRWQASEKETKRERQGKPSGALNVGAQRLRTSRPVTRARPRTRASAPHLQSALSSGLDEPSCVMNSAQSEHSSLKVEKPGKCQGWKVQKDKKSQEKVVQIGRGPPRFSRWLCYGTSDEFPDSGHLLIVTISMTPPSPCHHHVTIAATSSLSLPHHLKAVMPVRPLREAPGLCWHGRHLRNHPFQFPYSTETEVPEKGRCSQL